MSDIHIITVSLIAVGIALFTVSYVNSLQTRKRLISQRLSQLKLKVSEMEELASSLETLLGTSQIEKVVLQDVLDTLKGMQQLSPENITLDLSIENVLQRLDELSSPNYQATLYRVLESDAQIARARFQLSEAGRIVRKRQAAGFIELPQMNGMIEDLAWAHLMVFVVTLTAQGHKAFSRGDILRAYSFYKKAQEGAMEANLGDTRRHKVIKELSEIQANKRKALSIELMPETEFNPKSDSGPSAGLSNQDSP